MALEISVQLTADEKLRQLAPNLKPLLREAQRNTANLAAQSMERRLKLAATGEILHVRSGALRDSVHAEPAKDTGAGFEARAGFAHGDAEKYAAVQEFGATITPKNGKYLWIPVGEALEPQGTARYSGPGDPSFNDEDVAFIFPKGRRPLFGRRDENDEFEALFVAVDSVTVPARHPVERSFEEVAPTMEQIAQRELDSAIERALGG